MLLTQADNDRTVTVRVGETVQISLHENATTGYRWTIERYDELIEALPSEASYTASAVGSGGNVAFAFRAKKAGAAEIVLKHWRHWEGDASVRERFRVRLQIQP